MICQFVIGFAVQKQRNDTFIHLHWGNTGGIVDGFESWNIVIIVNIKQLVIFLQIIMDLLGDGLEGILAFCKTFDGRQRIKERQVGCGIGNTLRLRCTAGTAG